MRRWLTYLAVLLATFPLFAEEWDLGDKRWAVDSDATEVSEDPGAWMVDLSLFPSSFWESSNLPDGIRVSAADGDTQLPVHIIGFTDNGSTGVGWLRVGNGLSASVNAKIYVYVGSGAAVDPTATYGARAAYDANVKAAWWFVGGSLVDTIAGLTLTNNNSATATTGPVAGLSAYEFSAASSRYLNTTSPPITGLPGMIEFWEYPTAATIEMSPMTLGNSAGNTANVLAEYDRGNISPKITQGYVIGGGGTNASPSITEHPYNQWNHISVARDVVDPGTTKLDRNGTTATNTTNIGSEPTYNRLSIGAMQRNTVALYFTGKVGPVFVHNAVRSANYNATIRNMILNPSSVMTVGTMEEAPAGTTGHPWYYMRRN